MHELRFTFAAFGAALLSVSLHAAPGAAPTVTEVNTTLGLRRSAVIALATDHAPGVPFRMVVPIDGNMYTLDMQPASVRSDAYRVYTVGADGIRHEVPPTPERTFRGALVESPGSIVAASVLDRGLFARIERGTGEVDWIEPIAPHFPGRVGLAGLHVVYTDGDVLETGAVCGTTAKQLVDREFARANVAPAGSAPAGGVAEAELACDADFDYFQDYGSTEAVEDRINAVINQMNVQYVRDVGITHLITAILVRTSTVYTSTEAGALLNQMTTRWNDNHGDIPRDVAHLFTGKEIDGGTIGIAFIGVICDIPFAYGLVQSDFNGVFSCATDLSAHELGHNWDADHCTCPDNTMNPGITCTNVFSQASIDTIVAHRDSRNCLDSEELVNDDCSDAIPAGNGSTPFSTIGATTDGPPLPGSCDEGFGLDFVQDVWFAYTAPCTGTATVSLCDSSYDTRLAVYEDGNCPGALVECNDDNVVCGAYSLQSQASFDVTGGVVYLVRVGGFNSGGNGTMDISCDAVDCPEDVDGDQDVGFGDVLRILANWGPCPGCPEDIDGDGDAGFGDVLRVLANWGPCPM